MDYSHVPPDAMIQQHGSMAGLHPHMNGGRIPLRTSSADGLVRAPDGTMVPADSLLVAPNDSLVSADGSEPFTTPQQPQNTSGIFQQGEFVEVKHVVVDGGDRFSPSAVAFDRDHELVWMGNEGGHVTSYNGQGLQKYTSFQVHENAEVRQIVTVDNNVICLFPDNLRCWSKFGRCQFVYNMSTLSTMQCMLHTQTDSLLLGGHQPMMVEFDLSTRTELRQVEIGDPGCAILRQSQNYVCAGDTNGKVTLRDPASLRVEHELQAHSGSLSDFDVHGNQLITCGFTNRMGSLHVDQFLMIYDLRMMRPMPPMQVHLDPMFLRFVPTFSNRICIVSQSGQFQVTEQGALTPSSMIMYQVQNEGAPIVSFDISSTCQAMAFGDSGGYLHLFMKNDEDATFNSFSKETEFPHLDHQHPPITITDVLTPYSIIPMTYPSQGELVSDWPENLCVREYRKPQKIDPDILRSMKIVQNVGYAPNPGTRRRNQVPYVFNVVGQTHKERKTGGSVPDSPLGRGEDPWVSVPKQYRRVEIKYSKLGVEDFDFRHYNRTNFAGLETHIPNAYCNSMLQVLYFIEPLRCVLLSHLCDKEFCLSCELGFLFQMLDKQKGKTCQASNFLRAFRTIPEAAALGLVLNDAEETMGKVNLPRLIQNWSRFIMQQVHSELCDIDKNAANLAKSNEKPAEETEASEVKDKKNPSEATPTAGSPPESEEEAGKGQKVEEETGPEGKAQSPEPPDRQSSLDDMVKDNMESTHTGASASKSIVKDLFGCELENIFKCRCGNLQSRKMSSCIIDLNYQEGTPREKAQIIPQVEFAQIVQRSMCQEQHTQAWCPQCDKYQPHVQSKDIKSLPDVLALNCHLESVRDFEFWRAQEEYVKAKNESEPSTNTIAYSARTSLKMCRYGKGCTRKDCKFRHEGDFASEAGVHMSRHPDDFPEKGWVPYGLRIKLTKQGKVEVSNIETEEAIPSQADEEEGVVFFELLGDIAHIQDLRTGGNLVGAVKVGEPYHRRKERVTCTQWYLLNDFAIKPIEKQEAVHFSLNWKVPCVLFFQRSDLCQKHALTVNSPIADHHLLIHDSLVRTPRKKKAAFVPLSEDELPTKDSVVGLDAEFVTLNQEEAELRSDGTRSTLKPSQLSVARVTCVRGWETLEGEPFIDDYISTQEQVVDYLTQFSGIQPGDLDPDLSSKHLTTLKSTYVKLRHLVDVGVTFVGHGLKKDFRVLNLVVPATQIIDTVELFRLPRHRMISLKFLAWYFLSVKIQSVTHDSTEDARTALQLYKKYQELSKEGMEKVRATLKEMYERGRSLQWKIPTDEGEAGPPAMENPIEAELQEIM